MTRKNAMTRKHVVCAVVAFVLAGTALDTAPARAAAPEHMSDASTQMLAWARRDGREIRISEALEDGVPAMLVSVSGPTPDADARVAGTGHASRGLDFVALAALAYENISGEPLPLAAERRMLEIDARIDRAQMLGPAHAAGEPSTERANCPKTSTSSGFAYDCTVHGEVLKTETSTPRVCLLTSALSGSHTMEVAYKAFGTFYYNATEDVPQGYSRAVMVKSVNRTRRGRIYNAQSNELTRFAFDGDWSKGLNTFGLSVCQEFIAAHD